MYVFSKLTINTVKICISLLIDFIDLLHQILYIVNSIAINKMFYFFNLFQFVISTVKHTQKRVKNLMSV